MILHAFATLNMSDAAVFPAIASCICQGELVAQFTAQGIANTIWAYATIAPGQAEVYADLIDMMAHHMLRIGLDSGCSQSCISLGI